MAKSKLDFKTVFLSDVHLGTRDSKAAELTKFLKHVHCEKLVLNGDIVDGWQLRRKPFWLDEHTKLVRHILKMMEKKNTEVVYLRGNHDDVLTRFLPILIDKFSLVSEHLHQTARGNYLVVHGDGFDNVTTDHKWVAHLGHLGYAWLLRFNRLYNRWRAWRGQEYFSLSKKVKAKVKSAVSFIGRYETQLQELAKHRGCIGIICGHIHTPENKMIGDIHYLNSGDWVESLTAVVEHWDGRFEVLSYQQFLLQAAASSPAESSQEAPLEDAA
ncbi:MAG: UDP-2,3-diacylglucosamine diphosphatase [Verrucomicrobiota bacterium]